MGEKTKTEDGMSYTAIGFVKYAEGDRVICGGGTATIVGIGEQNNMVVYDLDNGLWCYEYQIIGLA